MSKKLYTHPDEAIILNIRLIRWQKVLLDSDLAKLYGVEVKALNQAVKRNKDRFPLDFMFQLTDNEANSFISHRIAQDTSSEVKYLKSQIVTSKVGRWGARKHPYAFTEQWIAMLSSVLNSPTAIHVNIQIIRIFVKMREMLSTHLELQQKIEAIEQSLGITNHEVQELYRLFISLVENNDEYTDRKIGFKVI